MATFFNKHYKWCLRLFAMFGASTRLALAFRPEFRIFERPYQEDAFYLFNCANHLAHGFGLSVDGVHLTNGVQPLLVLLYTPLFGLAGPDKWLAVRLSFMLFAALNVINVYLIAGLIRLLHRGGDAGSYKSPSLFAAFFLSFLLFLMQFDTNGLETGLYATVLLSIAFYYLRIMRGARIRHLRQNLLLGLLLGVLVLSRIDGVFFVLSFGFFEVIYGNEDSLSKRLRSAAIFSSVAFLVSSPWWIYNLVAFGNLMPISGQSESIARSLSLNLTTAVQVMGDILSMFFYTPFNKVPTSISSLWFVVNLVFVLFIFKRFSLVRFLKRTYALKFLLPFALGGVALLLYYTFFFSGPHFLARYLYPVRLFSLLIFAMSLPSILAQIQLQLPLLTQVQRIVFSVMLFCYSLSIGLFSISRYVSAFALVSAGDFYYVGEWATHHMDGAVGMTSSGIASFISPNVINLDGKVNAEALRARKRGEIVNYFVDKGIRYIADDSVTICNFQKKAAQLGVHFVIVDRFNSIFIMMRMDSDASTEKNDRLWRPL